MTIKLYILVRTDMASMNAGRVAAQVAHAANYFVKASKKLINIISIGDPRTEDAFIKNFNEWENETDYGTGTIIVLDGGDLSNLTETIHALDNDYITGIFIDPEYTIKDGNFIHVIPDVVTCAFAFQYASKEVEDSPLRKLNLYAVN